MTLLGDILLGFYAAPSTYTEQAIVAAVEELEKHAAQHPVLVARVELAMVTAGNVSVPFDRITEVRALMYELKETA